MSTTSILENADSFLCSEKVKKEIEELVECIRLERKKYNEYLIIKDVAFTCATEESELCTELQLKLYNILTTPDVEQCMELLPRNALLGLSLDTTELSYEEKHQIKVEVQRGIIEKSSKLFAELDELGISTSTDSNNVITYSSLDLNVEDKVLIGFKKELNEKQQLYVAKLEELSSVLNEIVKLKSKTLPEVANEKIRLCEVKSQLYRLQSQVINTKLRVNIFNESSNSMDAYRALVKDILQQQSECKQDIEKLKELKEKYKQVSCKQYSEILQNYTKYKTNVENKMRLCSQLNAK